MRFPVMCSITRILIAAIFVHMKDQSLYCMLCNINFAEYIYALGLNSYMIYPNTLCILTLNTFKCISHMLTVQYKSANKVLHFFIKIFTVKPVYLEHVDNWFLKLFLYYFNEYIFKNQLSTRSR
jgi:hypothetical protein